MPLLIVILTLLTATVSFAAEPLTQEKSMKTATFAGGCFWCMVKPFQQFDGVESVVSGYTGGDVADPTYREVTTGKTGHLEAVQITYDEKKISYDQLLTQFWRQIDPTDGDGQFADRGSSYRTAIFYNDEEQKAIAEKSRDALQKEKRLTRPIQTKILPAKPFYPAEEYHQDYHKKNPLPYDKYFAGSGRMEFQTKFWDVGNIDRDDLKKRLTKTQFDVTQNGKTEPPFKNEFWDNHAEGIYVDIVDGRPLFASTDKFDSGCGWPSFAKPIAPTALYEKSDFSLDMKRTEVRSFTANSHLGHVFDDGPKKLGGLRYCINSASLRFVPKAKMKEEGYGDLLPLFDKQSESR